MYRSSSEKINPSKAVCPSCDSRIILYSKGSLICSNCGYIIYKPVRRNKYNARKTLAKDGKVRDSAFEANVADELAILLAAGEILGYDSQYKVDLSIYDKSGNVVMNKTWKVDFRVHNLDGTFTLLEAKGLEGDDYKWKRDILINVWLPEHLDYSYEVRKQRSYYNAKKFSTGKL